MARATGLISALINIALFKDVPFTNHSSYSASCTPLCPFATTYRQQFAVDAQ